jgi:hypothetical protein
MRQAAGVALVVLGGAVAAYGLRAATQAQEMSLFIAQVGAAVPEPFDAEDWSWRWRANAMGFSALGFGALSGGVGLLARWWFVRVLMSTWFAIATVCFATPQFAGGLRFPWEASTSLVVAIGALAAVFGAGGVHDWRRG